MLVLSYKGNYGDKIYNNKTVSEITSKKNVIHDWMDAECVDLCDALNSIKGIKTFSSCCGHNEEPFQLHFNCSDLDGLKFIVSCIDNRYWEFGNEWTLSATIGDEEPHILNFWLRSESSNLETINHQVRDMIETLNYYLNHKNRFEFLGLDYKNFIFNEVEEVMS
jgi:hypothetical protein